MNFHTSKKTTIIAFKNEEHKGKFKEKHTISLYKKLVILPNIYFEIEFKKLKQFRCIILYFFNFFLEKDF